jgi:NAD(P)-dependent dehydrogenase (short-subunit alcohol dehydrogenase family)
MVFTTRPWRSIRPDSAKEVPNTYDLTGRTVLVTGGAQGLGRAIAELALASGARVCIADIQGAEKTAEALGATGVALDVTDPASVQAGVAVAVAALGGIDVLVNNAGISGLGDPKLFLDTEPAEWNAMVERGEGVVVNIASVAGVVPLRGRGPYSVSKAALVQLTRAMAAEYAAAGIRVTAIGPGAMDTPFIRWRLEDPELGPAMLAKIPVGRVVSPEEIAEMVVFLASPGAAYINGAHLLADGAMSCTI